MAEITDIQLAYIEWYADPARAGSKEKWAEDHGVHARTLNKWEKTPWFRDSLERYLLERAISPEHIFGVLEVLRKDAARGDVQSARAYMQEIDKIRPPRKQLEDASVASLSDEELELAWQEGLAALKRAR